MHSLLAPRSLAFVAGCANTHTHTHKRVPRLRSLSEATMVRTAGGRVRDALGTLLVLSAVGNLGRKGTVMVVHHTDCGLCSAGVVEAGGDEAIRRALLRGLERDGEGKGDERYEEARRMLEGMRFGSFAR